MELSKLLILPTLLLTIVSCGGGGGESTSKNTEIRCANKWQLWEDQPDDYFHYEDLIDSCTQSTALFPSPDETKEWDMNSANRRANIIISGDLASQLSANNFVMQVNVEQGVGETVLRSVKNLDYISAETQYRQSDIRHPNGLLTRVEATRFKHSSSLSEMDYEQRIIEYDDNWVLLRDELVLHCTYLEQQDEGRCWATPDSTPNVLVASFEYAEWIEIQEQFDRGVEVDSATAISILINNMRTD